MTRAGHPKKKKQERLETWLSCACCPIFHNLILDRMQREREKRPSSKKYPLTIWFLFSPIFGGLCCCCGGFSLRKVLMPIDYNSPCFFSCRTGAACWTMMICDSMHEVDRVWSAVFKLCIKYEFMKLQWRYPIECEMIGPGTGLVVFLLRMHIKMYSVSIIFCTTATLMPRQAGLNKERRY